MKRKREEVNGSTYHLHKFRHLFITNLINNKGIELLEAISPYPEKSTTILGNLSENGEHWITD